MMDKNIQQVHGVEFKTNPLPIPGKEDILLDNKCPECGNQLVANSMKELGIGIIYYTRCSNRSKCLNKGVCVMDKEEYVTKKEFFPNYHQEKKKEFISSIIKLIDKKGYKEDHKAINEFVKIVTGEEGSDED